jgi:hypothetical protein
MNIWQTGTTPANVQSDDMQHSGVTEVAEIPRQDENLTVVLQHQSEA